MAAGVLVYETPDMKGERESQEKAIDREFRDLSGRGSFEELAAAEQALLAEAEAIRQQLPMLRFRAEQDRDGRVEAELAALIVRSNMITLLQMRVSPALWRAREERADSMAFAWGRSAETAILYAAFLAAEADALAPIAALYTSYQDVIHAGARKSPLPAIPPSQVQRLVEFERLIGSLRRYGGMRIDVSKFPAAVRARLEARP